MLIPACIAVAISDNKLNGAVVGSLFIVLLDSLTMFFYIKHSKSLIVSKADKLFLSHQKSAQSLLKKSFSSHCLFWITDCHFNITIPYTLPNNNILVSFGHPLCNLKHMIFLIILLYNTPKSFSFYFTQDLMQKTKNKKKKRK